MRRIIDVREVEEYIENHVEGAVNIPTSVLSEDAEKALSGINKDDEIILYCRSGTRAGMVAQLLAQHGFAHVVNGINQANVEQNYL